MPLVLKSCDHDPGPGSAGNSSITFGPLDVSWPLLGLLFWIWTFSQSKLTGHVGTWFLFSVYVYMCLHMHFLSTCYLLENFLVKFAHLSACLWEHGLRHNTGILTASPIHLLAPVPTHQELLTCLLAWDLQLPTDFLTHFGCEKPAENCPVLTTMGSNEQWQQGH